MKAGVSVTLCIHVPAPLVPLSLPWGDHPRATPEPSSGHTGEMLLGKVESTDDTVRSCDSALKAENLPGRKQQGNAVLAEACTRRGAEPWQPQP